VKLWYLYPVNDRDSSRWSWDCVHGFVIRAETEEDARAIAVKNKGDEPGDSWSYSQHSHCVELLPEGVKGVVLKDFNAG